MDQEGLTYTDGCTRRPHIGLVIGTLLLSGCAGGGFDLGRHVPCPPVVEYSREVQARVSEELALLPEKSVIAEMLADYAVMREQVRVCAG